MNGPQKAKAVMGAGRDCLVRFSPVVSLRYMADSHGTDSAIAHKLARVARIHFSRQKLAASGPNLPQRQVLFARLMKSPAIEKAIEDEAQSKDISIEKARKEAHSIMDEIAADFSYGLVKNGDRILGWLWTKLYQGLHINNASTVRRLAQDGHEIVYVPCHRSHMDYLLLSYVLYHEGMVPPHIAAGINLNFFPAAQSSVVVVRSLFVVALKATSCTPRFSVSTYQSCLLKATRLSTSVKVVVHVLVVCCKQKPVCWQ